MPSYRDGTIGDHRWLDRTQHDLCRIAAALEKANDLKEAEFYIKYKVSFKDVLNDLDAKKGEEQ